MSKNNSKDIIKFVSKNIGSKLTGEDRVNIEKAENEYNKAIEIFKQMEIDEKNGKKNVYKNQEYISELEKIYENIGKGLLRGICQKEERIHVYPFETQWQDRAEVSRLISKLRNIDTNIPEFTYYIQRGYELLFKFAFHEGLNRQKNHQIVKTPVNFPYQNYAVHKLPNMDDILNDTVMCVMLRGALLPSMIMAKEIQEYSSKQYSPDFALFRIKRNENGNNKPGEMEYVLNLKASYFDLESLNNKHLIFADPMNATGGSMLAVLQYLNVNGVKPKSVKSFHIITSFIGALQSVRENENLHLYTLWVDPVLNEKAYILPGLGDAGDRINGFDEDDNQRNILQLMTFYSNLNLYKKQIQKIEEIVIGKVDKY